MGKGHLTKGNVASFLGTAALALLLFALAVFFVCSLGLRAYLDVDGPYEEQIHFFAESVPANLLVTACALAALLVTRRLLERFGRTRLSGAMLFALFLAAVVWVLSVGLIPERDCESVMNAAKSFARGDYELLHWGYFRGAPYQLGIVLLMEGILRLFPGIDLNMTMQCLNAALSVSAAGLLAATAERAFGGGNGEVRRAAVLLYVGFLPLLLYNVYVYGTIPMLFCCSLAVFLFARYVTEKDAAGRHGKTRLLAGMAVSLALGYALKSNALIVMIAVAIVAVLYLLGPNGEARPLLAALLALVLGFALSKFVIWQYELRSGFLLEPNVNIMLTYLMMGFGRPSSMPGWYNGYAGRFFDMYLTADEQRAIVLEDLAKRLPQLIADPAYTAAFLRDKLLSQWLEPTYSTVWYGYRCDWSGHFNGVAAQFYRPFYLLNAVADAYMNVYQQALYLLSCIGIAGCIKKRRNATALLLPVMILGGLLFHTLFEAKSQYLFPYALYMIPLAAKGLCMLSGGVARALARNRVKR